MIAWGNTTDRIMHLLQDNEMTKLEICSALGLTHDNVSGVLSRLKRKSRDFDKRVYIKDYKREAVGKRFYLRAIYKAGSARNAKKPLPLTQKERSARSNKRRTMIKQAIKLNAWMGL